MSARDLSIRRAQLVTSFGPGSIFDFGEESLIALDTGQWPLARCPQIRLERLERRVGARQGFRMPPVPRGEYEKNPPRVPFYRFPRWLFCPACRRLIEWSPAREKEVQQGQSLPRCCHCPSTPVLVPMRFVLVCKSGHLDDVDWYRWAHSRVSIAERGQCSREASRLFFRTRSNVGGGLEALYVVCDACEASRDFEDLLNPEKLRASGVHCSNRQPWQRPDGTRCDQKAQVVQRGASNVYFPSVVSALDIPLGGGAEDRGAPDRIREHHSYATLEQIVASESDPSSNAAVRTVAQLIADDLGIDVDDVIAVVAPSTDAAETEGRPGGARFAEYDILVEEWPALLTESVERERSSRFLIRREPLSEESEAQRSLVALIDRVMLVERLREVRALTGFSRLEPSRQVVPPDLGRGAAWLPGIEVFGEGVFIAFREESVREWSERNAADLADRLGRMRQRQESSTGLASLLPQATPRLVLLHTLSHLLIRQLCFECGYDSASLRERIYSAEPDERGDPMAGLLIYTADSDAEGSLGGLVRQGETDRLAVTLLAALDKARWCSSDPICRELPGQGLDGLNRAACHACTLVAETSCPMHNVLLDREIVIGSTGPAGRIGFFGGVLESLDAESDA